MTHTPIKCVIWDLDRTVWMGILAEGDHPQLRPGIAELMEELDQRGVLQSVASRGDERSLQALQTFNLAHYLLYPQLGPAPKSKSLTRLADLLNIGLDSFVFVDDDPFERQEVRFANTKIQTLDPDHLTDLLSMPGMPQQASPLGCRRRIMLRQEQRRHQAQLDFEGSRIDFLRTLEISLLLRHAQPHDIQRAQELTQRTNQLNANGQIFDQEQLHTLATDPSHKVLVAELHDRFGNYGVISVALLQLHPTWTLRLFLVSCRVMNRNVSGALLAYLCQQAKRHETTLHVDVHPTTRNRPMRISLRMAGFDPQQDGMPWRADLTKTPEIPDWVHFFDTAFQHPEAP